MRRMGASPEPPVLSARTRAIVARRPVFDAHVDSLQRALDLGHDLAVRGPGQLDLERGLAAGLGAVVLVCWVEPEEHLARSFERARELLSEAHALAARRPDRLRLVSDAAGLAAARAAGCVAGICGMEGGHPLEESLERLEWFFERGLRVLTLVWNNHLSWVRSCQPGAGAGVPEGLSAFGREVVRAMNALGIVVDLSHAGERSFYDALETSAKPAIASHSGCRALHDHPRNLDDRQLRALAEADGVVGIVFHPGFLDADARAEQARVRRLPAYADAPGAGETARSLARQDAMRALARPLPAARLVDHVVHAAEVAGVRHVGLGSDFDGIDAGPQWIEDASGYPVLCELLLRRGFGPDEVEAILGGNMERVFAAATGPDTRAHGAAIAALGQRTV
jgi:membrane dipeptidase